MENRVVPKDKFYVGVESGIVNLIEKLPCSVFRTSKKQFKLNEKSPNNRRQQLSA
jgi:hypothetical protein